jgi:ribosomal protein L3 glutamine methyltransferase
MSRRPRPERRGTLRDWLAFAVPLYRRSGAAFGQVATNAHDEALYLLLSTLGLPLESGPEVLDRELSPAEFERLRRVLRRRLVGRVPVAYLTREAILGDYAFYVDERAIIPRSYFLEIIPQLTLGRRSHSADHSLPEEARPRLADVGTGTGCLAILLAHRFPQARVDAIDVSAAALEVAKINVARHRLGRRVRLWRSNIFDAVPPARYDLILSNPPYEPTARVDKLPREFKREPRRALDGGPDGLAIIRKLLQQASDRLKPGGRVLIEVGGLRRAIDREFAALRPKWLETADDANCVCEITALAPSGRAPR